MKLLRLVLALTLLSSFSLFAAEYPLGPDQELTPGMLCKIPDSYRYPEHIAYCERDVSTSLKNRIFQNYRELGFGLSMKKRRDYKIDHLIPLCAGGANDISNLWPQHKSVYVKTDAMEALACEKLRDAKIRQAEVVELILDAKHHLEKVPSVMNYLNSL